MKLTDITKGKLNEIYLYYTNTGNISDFKTYNHEDAAIYEAIKDDTPEEILESSERWISMFDLNGYQYAIIADGELTSDGEYVVGRVVEDENVENSVQLFGDDAETQSICVNRKNNKIVEFKPIRDFILEFQQEYVDGNIWGCYYHNDEILYETQDGRVFKNILR